MRRILARTGVLLVTGCAAIGLSSAPVHASAIDSGPSSNASCVGQVFVPQATGEPGTVADRIAFIKEFILPELGINFGMPISGLARTPKAQCFE